MNDFGRLLEREIPRLRRYARALTRDVSRADDPVQDTLVRAIAQQCGSDLHTWLFTLMHNQNVDRVRRSVREGIAVEFDDKGPFPTAATDPTGRLSLRDLDRALARISTEQRRVILLIGLEGTSYEEAATILDVPVGTIRARVFRGRESLHKLMHRRSESEAATDVAITTAVPKRRRFVPEDQPTQNFSRVPALPPESKALGTRNISTFRVYRSPPRS
jgi:RNA polymerase sigma-70 factor, ECF subfamily